jgi:hypothetical protein
MGKTTQTQKMGHAPSSTCGGPVGRIRPTFDLLLGLLSCLQARLAACHEKNS